jgi:hypothetical protein
MLQACSMVSQSEDEPITTPTRGAEAAGVIAWISKKALL